MLEALNIEMRCAGLVFFLSPRWQAGLPPHGERTRTLCALRPTWTRSAAMDDGLEDAIPVDGGGGCWSVEMVGWMVVRMMDVMWQSNDGFFFSTAQPVPDADRDVHMGLFVVDAADATNLRYQLGRACLPTYLPSTREELGPHSKRPPLKHRPPPGAFNWGQDRPTASHYATAHSPRPRLLATTYIAPHTDRILRDGKVRARAAEIYSNIRYASCSQAEHAHYLLSLTGADVGAMRGRADATYSVRIQRAMLGVWQEKPMLRAARWREKEGGGVSSRSALATSGTLTCRISPGPRPP